MNGTKEKAPPSYCPVCGGAIGMGGLSKDEKRKASMCVRGHYWEEPR